MNLVTHENSAQPGAMSPIATRWLRSSNSNPNANLRAFAIV
ncbi:hypothetical protein LG3211_3422 [Lysobacter gummosus]|nr:hypothetical protein LG3211_3422 [Lysobacter gummosus]